MGSVKILGRRLSDYVHIYSDSQHHWRQGRNVMTNDLLGVTESD